MSDPDWKDWNSSQDVPYALRLSVERSAASTLFSLEERDGLKKIILGILAEATSLAFENQRLKGLCLIVSQNWPNLPLQAVFKAVSLETGAPVSRLRKLWFKDFSEDTRGMKR